MKAPWTTQEVEALNYIQHCGMVHPYTCGGNRTDEKHLDGEGLLVATKDGWVCPYCDYKQDWFGGDAISMAEEFKEWREAMFGKEPGHIRRAWLRVTNFIRRVCGKTSGNPGKFRRG